MSSVADLVERETDSIVRRLRERLDDARLHDLAARALHELVRSLRAAETSLPSFQIPIGIDALTRMLRELSTDVLDTIEAQVSTKDIRRVAEWFAAASERISGDANRRFVAMLDALGD